MLLQLLRGTHAVSLASRLAPTSGIINQTRNVLSKSYQLGKPKKPKKTSAYLTYISQEYRPLMKANPELTPKQVISNLAARWNTLDSEERQRFKQISDNYVDEQRKIYDANLQNFITSMNPEQMREVDGEIVLKRIKKKKEEILRIETSLGKPRIIANPFALFSNENRKKMLGYTLKKNAEEWSALSEAEKQKYYDLYRAKSEEYTASMAEYERRLSENQEAAQILLELRRQISSLKRTGCE